MDQPPITMSHFEHKLQETDFLDPSSSFEAFEEVLRKCDGLDTSSDRLDLLRTFIQALKEGDGKSELYQTGAICFLERDGLLPALLSPRVTPQDVNDIVKIPDLIANAFKGLTQSDAPSVCCHILRSIKFFRLVEEDKSEDEDETGALLVSKFCTSYSYLDEVMVRFVADCAELNSRGEGIGGLLMKLSPPRRDCVVKVLVKHSESASTLSALLDLQLVRACKDSFSKLLFSERSITIESHIKMICFLSMCLSDEEMVALLLKTLQLWGDPIIARGYACREVVHYTKIAFALFYHIPPDVMLQSQMNLVEQLMKGMPNHFHSADGRTVGLAKFFCELVTDSLKFYESKAAVSEDVSHPQDELCRQVLSMLHKCDKSKAFWYSHEEAKGLNKEPTVQENLDMQNKQSDEKVDIDDDDDDDSDLEPIESLAPPEKNKIIYLRNFLESLPDNKTRDDFDQSFRELPSVVRHQLALEHSQLGVDVLDAVFRWENEFDDAQLDEQRKSCLLSVLIAKPEGNVEHFCRLFHMPHSQPYRKNMVLDVLGRTCRELPLVPRLALAKAAFTHILRDEATLSEQDVIVRIPLVLFLSRTLCQLPPQVVEEWMVVSFLNAVTHVRQPDAATAQSITYAVSNVWNAIADREISTEAQTSIREARDWLVRIHSQ